MENYAICNEKLGNCSLICKETENYCEFVLENDSCEEMGSVVFSFDEMQNCIKLISVNTNEGFQHLGVATVLVCAMEHAAVQKGFSRVLGVYYPKNEFARAFYEKNRYRITNKDGGWHRNFGALEKDLSYAEVEQNYARNVLSFVVDGERQK